MKGDPKGVNGAHLRVTNCAIEGVPTLPKYTEEYKYEYPNEYTSAWEWDSSEVERSIVKI